MKLLKGHHLAYCTNIHRGEDWAETLSALQRYTLAVRERVCGDKPYAIGLRLSDLASRQLSDSGTLRDFQAWLERHNCYVFTINGFPYGKFHGTRVKEQVYAPDWTTGERLDYTNRLFDLLAELLPDGIEGSVSTVPCSFKEFIKTKEQEQRLRDNLWSCIEHIAAVSQRTGKTLHLGLEPEPLCYLETSEETTRFFAAMRTDRPTDSRIDEHLGVNYDTCHLAVEFEEPQDVIEKFRDNKIKVSKLHLSSALKAQPTAAGRKALSAFNDPVYFHQVVARRQNGNITRYRDLDVALNQSAGLRATQAIPEEEWRIHFHVPLHCVPNSLFGSTSDHLLGVLDALKAEPTLCHHLEMETYTWEVLPREMKNRDVVEQLAAEYAWTLARLRERALAD
jgi:hypothetical protein